MKQWKVRAQLSWMMFVTVKDWPRVNINKVDGIKPFLEELYGSCGATFNMKSGRADRKGTKDVELYGYRKCIMQVHNPNLQKPRMKGLHQDFLPVFLPALCFDQL